MATDIGIVNSKEKFKFRVCGIIERDDYDLAEGKQFIYKHKGDFVPECPSSVASRIAVVIKKAPLATVADAEKLLIGDERIKFWKKK